MGHYKKCYKHNDKDAVGICSNCNKAVCADCSKETNNKIICHDCYLSIIEKGELQKIITLDPTADYNYFRIFGIKMSFTALLLIMFVMYIFTDIPIIDIAFTIALFIITYITMKKWKYERALLFELLKSQK